MAAAIRRSFLLCQKPTIVIPDNVQRAEVPINPALAVFSRFGELAK
ncbi:hypothetical protein [Paenibacillus sp. MY03]|jgi:hypothetical protein|nr:hypothetical protein [Paenibacillus sp. MY03]